jgi:hypothetical protein
MALAGLGGGARMAGALDSLLNSSPFLPAAAPVVPAPIDTGALAGLELAGILVIDKQPRFSIRDTASGRGTWIPLGGTEEGLTVTAFDEHASTITVSGRGTSRTLTLREAAIRNTAANAPAPSVPGNVPRPAPAAPAPLPVRPAMPPAQPALVPGPPRTTEEAEREARMLVSDLMEISMRERQRYEQQMRERQAQAAAELQARAAAAAGRANP